MMLRLILLALTMTAVLSTGELSAITLPVSPDAALYAPENSPANAGTPTTTGVRADVRRGRGLRAGLAAGLAHAKALLAPRVPPRGERQLPNGMAVAGFVLSLSFFFTSIFGPLLGLIFSAIGLSRALRYPEFYGRRNMALAGLIISGVLLLLIGGLLYVALITGA